MSWRAVQEAAEAGRLQEAQRELRHMFSMGDSGVVRVSDRVFGDRYPPESGVDAWDNAPFLAILSSDPARAGEALERSVEIISRTAHTGQILEPAELESTDLYTPNNVMTGRHADIPVIDIDTKGELTIPMGETFLDILTRELQEPDMLVYIAAVPQNIDPHLIEWA